MKIMYASAVHVDRYKRLHRRRLKLQAMCYSEAERKEEAKKRLKKRLEKRESRPSTQTSLRRQISRGKQETTLITVRVNEIQT